MKIKLTLATYRRVLAAAVKRGFFFQGFLFEYEPEVSSKLLQDRDMLYRAIENLFLNGHLDPSDPKAEECVRALRGSDAGWPKEDESEFIEVPDADEAMAAAVASLPNDNGSDSGDL